MATIGNLVLTLSDWAKRLDPNGKVDKIVEMLMQTNEMLIDMLWKEGNLPIGEQTTIRTGLPQVFWRLLNAGVQPSKSTTAQVTETTGMLEAWSEVDKDLAELNGEVGAFRLSEAEAFIEAMNQEMQETVIYGNGGVAPEEFSGLALRYSSLAAANAKNIVTGGGAGADNTSIWLVVWGANKVFGVFPKASKAGISHEDLGLQTIEVTNGIGGSRMRAYQDHWQWKAGIALKDWRYVVRIPNLDVSDLVAESSPNSIIKRMIKAYHRPPDLNSGKASFYMNRTVFQYLDIQRFATVQAGGGIDYEVVDGKKIPVFRGVPIRRVDKILENEALVA